MILTTNGVKSQMWQSAEGDEFSYLISTIQRPVSLMNESIKSIETYKINKAPQAVFGEPNSGKRVDGIKSRSVLFIDVDDMTISYKDLAEKVAGYLSAFGLNYVIYPTIRNGIAAGVRVRIGIPLSRSVDRIEYFKLWSWFMDKMRLEADKGGSGHTEGDFNHLQGIYVLTSQNKDSAPVVENSGKPFPIDELLPQLPEPKSASPRVENHQAGDLPKWVINNQLIIKAMFDPEQYYQELGGWDNMLAKIGGWLYHNGQDIYFTADIVQQVNEAGSDPIPNKELIQKFKSWARNWRR